MFLQRDVKEVPESLYLAHMHWKVCEVRPRPAEKQHSDIHYES